MASTQVNPNIWQWDEDEHNRRATQNMIHLVESTHGLPVQEFVSMFDKYPHLVTLTLKQLRVSNDRRRFALIASFPWATASDALFKTLADFGLPATLIQLLSDQSWYDELGDLSKGLENKDLPAIAYTQAVYLLMRVIGITSNSKQPLYAARTCNELPLIFPLIWRYRNKILPKPLFMAEGHVAESLISIFDNNVRLTTEIYGPDMRPPPQSFVAHVMCYIWINSAGRHPRAFEALRWFKYAYNLIKDGHSMETLIRDPVVKSIGSERLQDVLCRILLDPRLVQEAEMPCTKLIHTLDTVAYIVQLCGSSLLKTTVEMERVLLAIAKVAHKHECLGHPDTMYDVCRQVVVTLGTFQDPDNSFTRLVNIMKSNARDLNFFVPVARVYTSMCVEPKRDTYIHMLVVLKTLIDFGIGHALLSGPPARKRREFHFVRRIIRLHWAPTLAELRNARLPPGPSRPQEHFGVRLPANTLKDGLIKWMALGNAFDLSENSKRSAPDFVDDFDRCFSYSQRLQGCSLKSCPCYGRHPLHGRKHVCTGCWTVIYCGPRCQATDWKSGHRDVCKGRQAREKP